MNKPILHKPQRILLYKEGDLNGMNVERVGQYLTEKTGVPFQLRGDIYERLPIEKMEGLAFRFAKVRVKGLGRGFTPGTPLPAEVDYEKRRIQTPHWKVIGIHYEGIFYQQAISELVLRETLDQDSCFILFTNQLFGTWGWDDRRYHVIASLYGFPNMISVSGLVEAPAKPKSFYLKRQMGLSKESLQEIYQGRFLVHGDPWLEEVAKGYAMQAFFFYLIGNPFCEDRHCRLFNSHWQEELLHCQLGGTYEYCPEHEEMLRALKRKSHSKKNKGGGNYGSPS